MSSQFSRRAFLKASALLSGAALIPPRVAAQQGATASGTPPLPPPKARITSSVMLWTLKGSFEEKLATVARAGLQSVELVSEHLAWSDAQAERYKIIAQSYNITIDALLAQHNWTTRPVTMVNPAHREAFLDDVRGAIVWAKKLNVPQIIVVSGNEQAGMTREAQFASMLESARQATALAEAADLKLILENLNSKVNHKGYFLTSAKQALQAAEQVDNPHFRLLFDIYHEYVQNGDPIPVINEAAPYVAVFHVADAPGRHDPGTGAMKWDEIYRAIAKTGYSGYITMEYLPQGDEVDSLIKSVTQMRRDLNPAMPPREPQPSPA